MLAEKLAKKERLGRKWMDEQRIDAAQCFRGSSRRAPQCHGSSNIECPD